MELSKDQYQRQFSSKQTASDKHIAALKQAWKNRDFEIEMYWKRTTYFWGFMAAAFAGYFLVITKSSANDISNEAKVHLHHAEYLIICLGFIFSLAWFLANKGSKRWQENWERHIDMLEDNVTGPVYKTIVMNSSYSVSTTNRLVSSFVMVVWGILAGRYYCSHLSLCGEFNDISWITIVLTLITLYFAYLMSCKEKKKSKRSSERSPSGKEMFTFENRGYEYLEP